MKIRSYKCVLLSLFLSAIGACKPSIQSGGLSLESSGLEGTCRGPNPQVMEYLKVCGPDATGKKVCKCLSKLVMGTDHLGNQWQQDNFPKASKYSTEDEIKVGAKNMFRLAVDYGINIFDTSPIYAGGIEYTLGNWIAETGRDTNADPNDDLYVITKGGFPFDVGPGSYKSRLSGDHETIVENVSEEIYWSFRNLHGNVLFWIMHRDDIEFRDYVNLTYAQGRAQTAPGVIFGALSDKKPRVIMKDMAGENRSLLSGVSSNSLRDHFTWTGVSNWKTPRVNEAIRVAEASGGKIVRPMLNSPYFSLFEMEGESFTIHSGGVQVKHHEMMDPGFQKGILIMPYSPLGGFPIFSSSEESDSMKAWNNAEALARTLDSKRDRYWGNVLEAVFTPQNRARYERLVKVSSSLRLDGKKMTKDQWANAWVLAHPRTDLLAVGPTEPDHLQRTIDSLNLARALKTRIDILDWLYNGDSNNDGRIDDVSSLKPL